MAEFALVSDIISDVEITGGHGGGGVPAPLAWLSLSPQKHLPPRPQIQPRPHQLEVNTVVWLLVAAAPPLTPPAGILRSYTCWDSTPSGAVLC